MNRIFLSPGNSQKDCLSWFIQVLKLWLRLRMVQKGGFVSFKITPSIDILLCVYSPQGNSWLGCISLKNYIIMWDIKRMKMKTNYYLETLIVLWIKWIGMVEIKHKDFIDFVPIMSCQNSLYLMGSTISREGRTQNLEFTWYDRTSCTRSRKERIYTDIKFSNDIKITTYWYLLLIFITLFLLKN